MQVAQELVEQMLMQGLGPGLPADDDPEWELEAEPDAGGEADEVDWDASPLEVVRRIESVTMWLLSELVEGRLPDFEIVSRQANNRVLEAAGQGEEYTLRLQQRRLSRSLAGRHPDGADQVARIFLVLAACHELLLAGEQATQRELYYRLKTQEVVRSLRDVAEAVQDCVCLLRVPRSLLGITASGKGLVAGRLVIHDRRTGAEVDCSLTEEGHLISGDIGQISQLAFQTDAACVVVVEKDAIFQRLLEQQFPALARCVLVTGKGVPDLATRAFLASLAASFPTLALLALMDWNPAGLQIAAIYRYGSHRMGLESTRYALPTLRLLGARACQLADADGSQFQALTPRDRALATSLGHTLRGASPAWVAELRAMVDSGSKAELEAVVEAAGGTSGFVDLLLGCLERCDAI